MRTQNLHDHSTQQMVHLFVNQEKGK